MCLMATLILTSCGEKADTESKSSKNTTATYVESDDFSYMALVNKTHKLPKNWEKQLKTVKMTNSVGDEVETEKKAYDAYQKLKAALKKEKIYVDLDSARRSVKEQQRIMDDFTKQYGADYAAKTVAKPGYSEHHTGLALDLYLIVDGKDIVENEDMIKFTEIWAKIHKLLPKYGFILRYLEGKEHITGYGYEPWHIRYIDDAKAAKEITDKGITFESYLGTASEDPVKIDYGKSKLYTKKQLEAAVIQIKCKFAFWHECKLENIRYAGDKAVTEKNLKWINSLDKNNKYKKICEFLMDFHTPEKSKDDALESDHEYKDYQWWLAQNEEGGWDIVSQGY